MLKVAVVGCGKVADQHVAALRHIDGSRIVSLCDQEILMARQLGERCRVDACFSDVQDLLETDCPDVVHITTPPQSHFPLASQCLEAGAHVYLEKPFTVTADEAETLIQAADARGLQITAGHNYQFTPEMLRMRRLVEQGFLGGRPVHLESHWSYDLGDASYAHAMLGSTSHWVRQLPGQLLHNIISHGIAKLVEFLDDDLTEVLASATQSRNLAEAAGGDVLDELRVMIRDRSGTSAFFCFSTQLRPGLNRLRVCGPSRSLLVDYASGSLIRSSGRTYKSYLVFLVPPLETAWEHLKSAQRNIWDFMRRELRHDGGMRALIERFHASIRTGCAPPIPHRQILLTARIMDEIFAQIYPVQRQAAVGVFPQPRAGK